MASQKHFSYSLKYVGIIANVTRVTQDNVDIYKHLSVFQKRGGGRMKKHYSYQLTTKWLKFDLMMIFKINVKIDLHSK